MACQLQRDMTDTESNDDAEPMRIFSDSRGALAHITTTSGIMKARTKHIDVCYHNSRDLHSRRIVQYGNVNTDDNPTDLLTKSLPRGKHERFTRAMDIW